MLLESSNAFRSVRRSFSPFFFFLFTLPKGGPIILSPVSVCRDNGHTRLSQMLPLDEEPQSTTKGEKSPAGCSLVQRDEAKDSDESEKEFIAIQLSIHRITKMA